MGCATDSEGEELQRAAAHARRLRPAPQLPPCWWWAWAARPTRSRAWWRRRACSRRRPLVTFNIQDTGGTAKTVARGVELIKAAAARGQPRAAPAGAGQPPHGRACSAAAATATRASAPTRRWARRSTAGAPRRHRDPQRDARDLRRRAPADAPRGEPAVADKLLARIQWWEALHRAQRCGEMDNNPSAGNKAGGLTTILEKSLGAIAKGGTTNLVDVVRVRRAGDRARLRLHGHAGLRPGVGHRPGGRRRQPDLLHHRPRLGLRLRAERRRSSSPPTRRCGASRRRTSTSNCGEIVDGSRHGGRAAASASSD
jgi:altronate hydrolase